MLMHFMDMPDMANGKAWQSTTNTRRTVSPRLFLEARPAIRLPSSAGRCQFKPSSLNKTSDISNGGTGVVLHGYYEAVFAGSFSIDRLGYKLRIIKDRK